MPLRVGLNGAGRIGRLLLRLARREPSITITAVNDVAGPAAIAHLLRHDSIHGPFPDRVECSSDDALSIGEDEIRFFREDAPEAVPWDKAQVELVVEATGRFTRAAEARRHLRAGVRRTLVTAVSPDADATVILGPHDGRVPDAARVVAAGSCTTHAAALPLFLLHQWFGVAAAEMTTVHCTTGSQVTIDGPHADPRRARSALLSIIPTSTSASQGLVQALPFLAGRLTCLAFRVPTATVSLVEIVAQTAAPVDDPQNLAARFRAAAEGDQRGRLGVVDEPLVWIDFRGDPRSAVVDAPLLARPGERLVRVVAWYDNESGYAGRVVDLLRLWSTAA